MRFTITLASMLAAVSAWAGATQSFYQVVSFPSNPAYFGSNVYLHDSTTPLHTRLAALAVTNRIVTASGINYTITNDPAAANDILVFSPASSTAYFTAQQAAASSPTNQIIDVAGIKYNITNQPSSTNDILSFNNANTTAWFRAGTFGTITAITITNGETTGSSTNGGAIALSVGPNLTNKIAVFGGITYNITNAPSTANDILYFDPSSSNACFATPWPAFQVYSSDIIATNGTAVITSARGSLVRLLATNPVTITFDSSTYPTNGISRVGLELLAGTNSVSFLSSTITNATAPTVSTNTWTSLLFRRTEAGLWKGRQ